MHVNVRYIVDDVQAAIAFYTGHLGFHVEMNPAPGFAMLSRGPLRLFLNAPGAGGAGQPGLDGQLPRPGGWSRFQLEVDDVALLHSALAAKGVEFQTGVIDGQGGKQVLVRDPSGNLVELFEAKR